jgi:hypothetical protein
LLAKPSANLRHENAYLAGLGHLGGFDTYTNYPISITTPKQVKQVFVGKNCCQFCQQTLLALMLLRK